MRPAHYFLFALLFISSVAHADGPNDRYRRLIDGVIGNFDELEATPHAFIATGETTRKIPFGGRTPKRIGLVHVRESKDRMYVAWLHSSFQANSYGQRRLEIKRTSLWMEDLHDSGEIHKRRIGFGTFGGNVNESQAKYFSPVVLSAAGPGYMTLNSPIEYKGRVLQDFLDRKAITCQPDDRGDIHANLDNGMHIIFGKGSNWMPIGFSFAHKGEVWHTASSRWALIGDQWVPVRYHAERPASKNRPSIGEKEWTVEYQWAFGDDIPKIDVDAKDWQTNVRRVFHLEQ